MDFRVVWTKTGLADLRDLVRYIARDDRAVAKRFGEVIVEKTMILGTFPRVGKIVPEFRSDSLRQIIVSPYRIVYEIDDRSGIVSVLRVWHGARDYLDESSLGRSQSS